jgi:hypothetical protein
MSDLSPHERRARRALEAMVVGMAVASMVGCGGGGGGGGSIAAPTFGQLQIPTPSAAGGWGSFTTNAPPPEVLPTRGRAVRIYFYAPAQSAFGVSLRELDGTVTSLPFNSGTPAPPEAGYFQILDENPASDPANPSIYQMHVRAPLSLNDQGNYDVEVVRRTSAGTSSPMVVPLRARKVWRVTVMVSGNGYVVSSPAGILCGVSRTGRSLTECSYEFGPFQVNLDPATADDPPQSVTRFKGWTGNCAGFSATCTVTLDGSSAVGATATFEPRSMPTTASACPMAPTVAGWRWIGNPGCSDPGYNPGTTLQCDSAGYFCCEPGNPPPGNPRCNGEVLYQADCRNQPNQGINARLIQPGGCYEVDEFP